MTAAAFEAFAATAQRRRVNTGRTPKAAVTVHEKRQAEEGKLSQMYRLAVRADRERCYALPGGVQAQAIVQWATRKMTPGDGDELIARVRPFASADRALRHRLLSDLDEAIVRLRVRAGLAEFDDPLPYEDDDVFRVIKRVLVQGEGEVP